MSDVEGVFTLQEVAERLHMPYRTLRDAVFADRWPHRKISTRRRLMTESDVQAVLQMTAATVREPEMVSEVSHRQRKSNLKALINAA